VYTPELVVVVLAEKDTAELEEISELVLVEREIWSKMFSTDAGLVCFDVALELWLLRDLERSKAFISSLFDDF